MPFTVRIPDDKVDKGLRDKLLAEAPAILAWAVKGAVAYAQSGTLGTAAAVAGATDAYRMESDPLGRFL
ncbi:MAG: putative primase/helicase [Thermomicrobiales bacterium]|nr:putative primase/helicase [Thermomicrobiales bacterium]